MYGCRGCVGAWRDVESVCRGVVCVCRGCGGGREGVCRSLLTFWLKLGIYPTSINHPDLTIEQ